MDKNINTNIGIYKILAKTNQKTKDGHYLYKCLCLKCNQIFYKTLSHLNEITLSCKHLNNRWKNRRIGIIYNKMYSRCYTESDKSYKWYGGKGVKICDEWLQDPKTFEQWALDNGYKDTLTIDRIDSNGDYEPQNCRWITLSENTRRAGMPNWITVGDETLTGRQWSKRLGIGINRINTVVRESGIDEAILFIKEKLMR